MTMSEREGDAYVALLNLAEEREPFPPAPALVERYGITLEQAEALLRAVEEEYADGP